MSVIIRGYPDLLPVGENFINLSDFNVMIDKHLIVRSLESSATCI